jgi:hypothetical protein
MEPPSLLAYLKSRLTFARRGPAERESLPRKSSPQPRPLRTFGVQPNRNDLTSRASQFRSTASLGHTC